MPHPLAATQWGCYCPRSMSKFRHFLALWPILLVACQAEQRTPDPPELTEAFSTLPLPPDPELVSRSASTDALQLTVRTPADLPQVAKYYRATLSRGNWRLISDMQNADGSTALYAEQDGPPLWVRIWKATDQQGTMVQLTGAVVEGDSLRPQNRTDSARPRS